MGAATTQAGDFGYGRGGYSGRSCESGSVYVQPSSSYGYYSAGGYGYYGGGSYGYNGRYGQHDALHQDLRAEHRDLHADLRDAHEDGHEQVRDAHRSGHSWLRW